MKSESSYRLIHIGLAIRLLRNLTAQDSVSFAIRNIDSLEQGLTAIGFAVSLKGLNTLQAFKTTLVDREPGEELSATANEINTEMQYVEKVVFAEAETKQVYTFPERRFNADYLLNKPEKLFKTSVFPKLPDLARSDIAASGRCVLFGEATASAFHILRATEAVLKHYYYHHKKRNRLASPMWGPMTAELRAKKSNPPPAAVLDSLDLVRKSYRNPTQHPEATYDIESAQDLMGVCIDLINRMAAELSAT